MNDQALYQEIGQLLFNAGPADASKIIVRVHSFSGDGAGRYEFDYVNDLGKLGRFEPGSQVVENLTELLMKLREYFLLHNLTSGAPAWTGCLISLDIDKSGFEIDFSYDD